MAADPTFSLLTAERRLEELLESAPDAILELDGRGRIVLLNRMAEQLFEYTREEMLGQPVEMLLPAELHARHLQHRASYMKAPVTRTMGSGLQLEARRKNGTLFPVEISLSPVRSESGIHVTAVIRDITERKAIEEQQREAEQRFRLMIAAVKDYAILTLDAGGNVVSWNSGAERIKQYTAEEIIGQHFSVFYLPEEKHTKPLEGLNIAKATGKFEDEGWRVRKDGSRFWASVTLTAVRNLEGVLVGFSKVTRDLTERKKVEEELQAVRDNYVRTLEERNREAEQSNRLKTEFLANMSHELRSPLHTIIGFAELLAEETAGRLNDKQKRFIGHIHNDSQHLLELINDLLDLSKIEAGRVELRRETFDIGPVVEETLISIRKRAAAKSLEVRTDLAEPLSVFADPLRFKQILRNLLTNAVKFTPESGSVWVEAIVRGDFVEISVADTGIGIPEDQRQTVFDKFYQVTTLARGGSEGTGLGLAITKRIVEQHGGNIWIENVPSGGSRFTFTIPASPTPGSQER